MPEPPQTKRILSRGDAALALLIGILSLALYVRTLVSWLLPSDSGEFQVLAYEVGITHTTGYPIYTLLAHLFISLLPVQDVAYRVNLFSAVMGAVTVSGVYLGARLLTDNRWAALFGALSLSVSFTFWSQALIAEVYTPAAAILIAVFILVVLWYRTGTGWASFSAGLLGGLGLGVHGSLAVFAPAVAIFLGLNWKRWNEWLAPALGGALAGAVLYAVAFALVDGHAPPANIFNASYGPAHSAWNLTDADLNSPMARILFVMSGGQWRSALFVNPVLDTPKYLAIYLSKLPREFSFLTLALVFLGLVSLIRRDWRLATLLVTGLLLQWLCYFNYRVGDIYVFYIPTYILMALLAAVGLAQVLAFIAQRERPGKRILQPVAVLAVMALGILPILSPYLGAVNDGEVPFLTSSDYLVNQNTAGTHPVASETVRQLDQNAIVFTDWNWLYPYYYAADIEQGRLDLQFIETYPRADKAGLASSVLDFIRVKFTSHPIYLSNREAQIERAGFTLRPVTVGPTRFYKLEYGLRN